MELFLNLAWLLLAGVLVWHWLQGETRAKTGGGLQLIAIAVLVAILFPVISMSDDLLAVQNASEADNYQRRDQLVPSNNHPVQPALNIIAAVISAGLLLGFSRFAIPILAPRYELEHPELAILGNRPPPAA